MNAGSPNEIEVAADGEHGSGVEKDAVSGGSWLPHLPFPVWVEHLTKAAGLTALPPPG